jgi:hypothetical protein
MINKNLPPDGSSYSSRSLFAFICSLQNIVGCAPSAPNVSIPRGYNRKSFFLSIVSKIACILSYLEIIMCLNNIVGCALSAPDGSSPRGYRKTSFFEYGLKRLLLFYQVQFFVGFFDLSFPMLTNSNHHWNVIVFNSCYSYACDVINLFAFISRI